jgi:TonB family protein
VTALPASLVVHGIIAGLVFASSLINPAPPRKPKAPAPRPVSVRRIDARSWAQNRALRTAKPLERPDEKPKGQIVDVAPGNDQRPVDSKFVAETNNRVDRETRAKKQTNKYSRATATTSENPEAMPSAKGAAPQKTEAPPQSGVNLTESMLGRRESLLSPSLTTSGTRETTEPQPVGSEAGSQRAAAGGVTEGGGAPNDALDVPEGDGTFLNTREWKHAGFFNRVKQAVSAKWDPHSRMRAKGGMNFMHKVTVVAVALRPDGSIADLFVQQSSGVDALDAEAMNAFTKAQPFANPPAALVQDGYIRFTFGFQITNETMNPLRMFRP